MSDMQTKTHNTLTETKKNTGTSVWRQRSVNCGIDVPCPNIEHHNFISQFIECCPTDTFLWGCFWGGAT